MTSDVAATAVRPRVHMFTRWRLLLGIVVVALLVSGVFLYRERAVEVQVTSPAFEDIESTVSATGTVIPANDFAARATFAGIVDQIDVKVGQQVHPGEMLLRMRDQYAASRVANARAALETAELNDENVRMNGSQEDRIAAQSDIARAQAEQQSAQKALATLKLLRQGGSASDAEVLAAQQRVQTADAALRAAQQRTQSRYRPEDLKNAELKIAADKATLTAERVSYRNANVVSPIAGTAYLIPVRPYDFVQMGADLVHVADLTKMSVQASFFEPDIKQIKVGEPVRVTWSGAPGRTWRGQIDTKPMAVMGDAVLRTGQCMVKLEDGTDGVPVNTSVTVIVTIDRHTHAMTLPREAVRTQDGRHFVYRVVDERLKETPVEVGLANPSRIEITSGLRSQDRVAAHVSDGGRLIDHLRIRVERTTPGHSGIE